MTWRKSQNSFILSRVNRLQAEKFFWPRLNLIRFYRCNFSAVRQLAYRDLVNNCSVEVEQSSLILDRERHVTVRSMWRTSAIEIKYITIFTTLHNLSLRESLLFHLYIVLKYNMNVNRYFLVALVLTVMTSMAGMCYFYTKRSVRVVSLYLTYFFLSCRRRLRMEHQPTQRMVGWA